MPGPFVRIISSSPSDGIEFRAERTYSESSHLNKEDSVAKLTRRQALAGGAANLMILKPGIAFGSQANSAVSFGIVGTGGGGAPRLLCPQPAGSLPPPRPPPLCFLGRGGGGGGGGGGGRPGGAPPAAG